MPDKIQLTSIEILREQIAATRDELPFTLEVKDLLELLPHSKTKISQMLKKYDYPEADPEEVIPNRKVGGRRLVPRDWFLAWYYGETDKKVVEEEYKVCI